MTGLPESIRNRWPQLTGPGVVAVSGGADSVALLRVLAVWVKPLVVAHVNHQLRGAASDADEQFVKNLAEALGLACETLSVPVKDEALKAKENLENMARRIRYEFMAKAAKRHGSQWVATGHTVDDQAETVLHRMLRGAGIRGLRGIARERGLQPGLRLVRPLLGATRAEVVAYLESLRQAWREDASNRDPAYTRNRIRHDLLPMLRSFNPAIAQSLARLAEQAGEIHAEQEAAAGKLLEHVELPAAGTMRILNATELRQAPHHRIRAMFRLIWERENWPMGDMTHAHWKRLVAIAVGEETATDLPGGVAARRKGTVVQLCFRDTTA